MQRLQRSQNVISQCIKNQSTCQHLNAFINVTPAQKLIEAASSSTGPLSKTLIAVKDNISTLELPTTCASPELRSHQSPYDATVVSLLRKAGSTIVGKTNMDEFGMGSHSTNSAFGPVRLENGKSAGGSSGGSAVAIATKQCHGALGTDTGGSVRLPAAYNGVVGFKPSYGLVSRWGVVAYANSLDTVGFIGTDVAIVKDMFNQVNHHDHNDPTSLSPTSRSRMQELTQLSSTEKPLRIGVPREYNVAELSSEVREVWMRTLQRLQNLGHSIQEVSLPSTQQALSAYYILAPAEASSNLAKYDSVRYGSKPEQTAASSGLLYNRARDQGFGDEVKRRILLGSYSLSADAIDNYFIQAQKIRRLVKQDFDNVFSLPNVLSPMMPRLNHDERVDALICPTAPSLPPTLDQVRNQSILDSYTADVFTVPASLAGLPAISIPVAMEHDTITSVGMQVITQYGDDQRALDIAALLEDGI